MNGFFAEVARANAVLCESLGLDSDTYTRALSAAESNGRLSFEEQAHAHRLKLRKIVVKQQREIRQRNANYAPGNFAGMVKREKRVRGEA